jgi:hypothetical protein
MIDMIDTQKKFAPVVGETYTNTRNVLGRGRGPRQHVMREVGNPENAPELADEVPGGENRFIVADALAWRITKLLSSLGMTWDEAADALRREWCADLALRDGIKQDSFFAVWHFYDKPDCFGAWRGKPSQIAKAIENDVLQHGPVSNVRMVSLSVAYLEAEQIAEKAGFAFRDGEIVPLSGTEV